MIIWYMIWYAIIYDMVWYMICDMIYDTISYNIILNVYKHLLVSSPYLIRLIHGHGLFEIRNIIWPFRGLHSSKVRVWFTSTPQISYLLLTEHTKTSGTNLYRLTQFSQRTVRKLQKHCEQNFWRSECCNSWHLYLPMCS